MILKICFLAPSEYGKNTAVKLLSKRYNIENIKLAEPLYHLQDYFYKFINKKMVGEQDGKLLQFLGKKIREEDNSFIINHFKNRLANINPTTKLITNDDCRPPDYKNLKTLGFIFIKINGFKRGRTDHTKSDPTSSLEWQNNIRFDYSIDNLGSIEDYQENLYNLIDYILKNEVKNEWIN